ncbi:MAG: P83/100 family protein [Spirochaetaceae bacterium]|jgi:hypothetical protein|nr:P83/100 family protein [Spirochaetaceae bacterium]
MKRLALLFCFVLIGPLFSQEVAEDEFMGVEPLEFTHFTGPYDNINTLEEIQGIGRALARSIDVDSASSSRYGYFTMVHSYQPEIPQGLDGDILILGEASGVDHIRNLRHIMAGYLEDNYGYSYERAYLLAKFITYYNAAYYQKIEHFQDRYKTGVMEHLQPQRCGLSTIYSQWPGYARIVIPLRNPARGDLAVIDTSIITQDEVIEEMRQEEDQNLDERKDMVELREEEIAQEEEQIQQDQQQIQQEEVVIQEELQQLQQQEELTPQEETRVEELQQELEDNQQEQVIQEDKQEEVEQRTEEVLDMRDDIARDENQQIQDGTDGKDPEDQDSLFTTADEPGPVPLHFFHYENTEDGIPYGRIDLYDLTEGKKTVESTVTTLYGRQYQEYSGKFLGIGKNRNNSTIGLMLIQREDLALLSQSDAAIFPGSRLEVDQSNKIYAVTDFEGQWYLGRFNGDLTLEVRSNQVVNPMTDILFYNGQIYVQDPQGAVRELNFQSLELVKEFN